MNFKLVSKNNMGVVATLILVILLSQSRFFNFLIDTTLGRTVLILFILVISYVNKILGVVAVLFIIIMFNQSSIGYLEGFTGANPVSNTDKLNKLKVNNDTMAATTSSATTTPTTTPTTTTTPITAPSTAPTTGREGFNTTDRELTMLRGKRSNEVPVLSNARSQSEDVDPTDKSVFTNSYSTF
jgi:hypothetical protein